MSTFDFPIVITSAGLQPQSPASLLSQLLAAVSATNPGYTANLPGSLVEDISSTDVAAIALCDAAKVELVNSLTPYGANVPLLTQLGALTGVILNQPTNTSVYVVFSGPPGRTIAQGFIVSDGTNQYVAQDGGIVGAGGTTPPLYALATVPGSWAVPANTVTSLVTSVPVAYAITVTNPSAGLPGTATAETEESYRARVVMAYQAPAQGMPTMLRTLLGKVAGVQARLVSIVQVNASEWEIICGGGDPYQVAYAIFTALFDVSTLVGSQIDSGRNQVVSINDFPDTYVITYVVPPQQIVTMTIDWHSTSPNYVNPATLAAAVQLAIVAYVNSIGVGQPMNLLQLQDAFLSALPSSIPEASISQLTFSVSINSTPTSFVNNLLSGDAESYFEATNAGIVVTAI